MKTSKVFEMLAEQRIEEAIRRGEFDHLPGAGKPLVFEDEPLVSPEQRMVNRILKNAGFSPREILLRKEIAALRQEIAALPPGQEQEARRRELVLLLTQLCEKSG